MIDERLVRLHDGEQPAEDDERERRSRDARSGGRDELEAIAQIDQAVEELDVLTGPTAAQVASAKGRLKDGLLAGKTRRRRRVAAIGIASTSIAACVVIVIHLRSAPVLGTVRYQAGPDPSAPAREEKLRPGSVVQASEEHVSAQIDLPRVASIVLTGKGSLRMGDQAYRLEFHRGTLKVDSRSQIRIALGQSPHVIVVEPGSSLHVHLDPAKLEIDQQQGQSSVTGGPEARSLQGRKKVYLHLPDMKRAHRKRELKPEAGGATDPSRKSGKKVWLHLPKATSRPVAPL